jgi:hypothetical protein
MTDRDIRVSPRPHPDGIDIDKLALVLLEVVNRLPLSRIETLATAGDKLIDKAEREVKSKRERGSAA